MMVYPAPRHDPEVELLVSSEGEQVHVEITFPSSLGFGPFSEELGTPGLP